MFYIYSFHFGIIIFVIYSEAVERKCYLTNVFVKFTRKYLYWANFINEENAAQCFPKPSTIFTKSSIVD